MKKVIKLTEEELAQIVNESVNTVLNEIGYRTASLAHVSNFNSMIDFFKNNTENAESKAGASDKIRLPALTKSIFSEVANDITLLFFEFNSKDRQFFPIHLHIENVYKAEKDMIVFYGEITVSKGLPKKGYIGYVFAESKFYQGHITPAKNFKPDIPLIINTAVSQNVELITKLLTHISNFMYSEEDYETTIITNGPTISKRHN